MLKTAYLFFVGGLFFIIDQVLKYFSRNIWTEKKLLSTFFGWYPFENMGVAFGIPVPSIITITLSFVVLFLLIYLFKHSTQSNYLHKLGLVLIICGATSNLIDRILFGFTTDYLLLLTGVINLADIMIVGGFGLFVFVKKKAVGIY